MAASCRLTLLRITFPSNITNGDIMHPSFIANKSTTHLSSQWDHFSSIFSLELRGIRCRYKARGSHRHSKKTYFGDLNDVFEPFVTPFEEPNYFPHFHYNHVISEEGSHPVGIFPMIRAITVPTTCP
ncbi:hypothetical protein, unlikely [Trypanosoma congolense IL3000]|uniref:Uncharacterized protein n=1 Tax=Trypanosoma congolense (strain IL3000) TaxID=1068625 RepID=F9WCQ6_TRYCI|nr:hypothetical protein, unlikely [Trypanosoma congolense IL3000]